MASDVFLVLRDFDNGGFSEILEIFDSLVIRSRDISLQGYGFYAHVKNKRIAI